MALATPQPARMRALNTLLGDRRPRGFLRRIDWWVGQLCSFEVMFTLFLYSNELKSIVPFPFPIDETVVFGGLCIPMMGYVAWREGLYVRGISVVTGALIFIFWAIITTTWSLAHKTAMKSIAYLLTFTLLSIVAGGMVIANKRERTVRFFYCALAVAMLMALVGIYIQFKTGDFRRWSQLDGTGRVYLAFGHTVVNGAGIAFCIGLFARVGSVRQALGTMMFATCCFPARRWRPRPVPGRRGRRHGRPHDPSADGQERPAGGAVCDVGRGNDGRDRSRLHRLPVRDR